MPTFQRWPIPDPIDADRVCIKLMVPDTVQHMNLLHGVLNMLATWVNYDRTGDTKAKQVADVWKTVVEQIEWDDNNCNECDEGDCVEYPNNAAIIEWHPNNPNTGEPDTVTGYPKPPWYKIFQGLIGGIEKGDILADLSTLLPVGFEAWFTWLLGLPELLLTTGLPRFRVHTSGVGVAELHLLQVPQGGYALIWYDDKPETAELVSLQSISAGSIVSLSAIVNLVLGVVTGNVDITPDIVHEVTITDPGEHYIDCVLLPNITLELTDAGWGGGLRKVVLCGFDEIVKPCEECPEEKPDMDIIEDWMEEIGILDPEELIEMFKCAMPFVGQIVSGIAPPGNTAWLKCDGSTVNKADYPSLWQVLEGKVTADELTFNLPDMRERILMGTKTEGILENVLDVAGSQEITLVPGNIPPHRHTIGSHTHTTDAHNHDDPGHVHNNVTHIHTINDPGHVHVVPGRDTSGFGAQTTFAHTNNSGTADNTDGTSSAGTGISINGADVTMTTEVTGIESAVVTVNASSAYQSGETGANDPFSVLNPVIGVDFYIFSGCVGDGC